MQQNIVIEIVCIVDKALILLLFTYVCCIDISVNQMLFSFVDNIIYEYD